MTIFKGVFILESLQSAWEDLVRSLTGVDSRVQDIRGTLDRDVKDPLGTVKTWVSATLPGRIDGVDRTITTKVQGVTTKVEAVDARAAGILTDISHTVIPTLDSVRADQRVRLPNIENTGKNIYSKVTGDLLPGVRTIRTTVTESILPGVDAARADIDRTRETLRGDIRGTKDAVKEAVELAQNATKSDLLEGIQGILAEFDGAQTAFGAAITAAFGPWAPLLSPLLTALSGEVLIPALQGALALGGTQAGGLAAAEQGFTTPRSPKTPEQAKDEWEAFSPMAEGTWTAMTEALMTIEGLSLGQMDYSPGYLLQAPRFSTMIQTAKNAYAIEHEVSLLLPLRYFYQSRHVPTIPQAQDLIRFLVKEVITPTEFDQYLGYHGFQSKWKQAYWDAHWRDLAAEQIQDGFHRGTITKAERDHYLVLIDYKPDPRPEISVSDLAVISSLAKTLIPRVDLRYGWELGRLTDEDLVERYEWLGYEDDAPLMAEIQKARALSGEIGQVRMAAIADFIAGFMSEEQLRADLRELGYGPSVVEYYVQAAAARRHTAHLKGLLDVYEDGYQKDLVEEEELRTRASEILVDPDSIDLFMDKAYVRKFKKPKAPTVDTEEKAAKEIQKYQISRAVQLYRRYTIEKPELTSLIVEAGLDPGVAAARADYEEARRPIEKPTETEIAAEKDRLRVAKTQESAAVESYRKGEISAETLTSTLKGLGYSPELAGSLTQLEILRTTPKPAPPKPEVVRLAPLSYLKAAYQEDLLTEEELLQELLGRGYSDESASLIVSVEKDKLQDLLAAEAEKLQPPEPPPPKEAPLAYVKAYYQGGFMDDGALTDELARRGYGPEAADMIVQVERQRYEDAVAASLERLSVQTTDELKAAPLSDVRAAYQLGLLTISDLRVALEERGYSVEAQDLMVAVESVRRRERETKAVGP